MIRLVKRAFQEAEISMPGETRELIFPDTLSVQQLGPDGAEQAPGVLRRLVAPPAEEPATISTDAEAGLLSDADEIEEQARRSRKPEEGEDLLEPASDD